MRTLLNTERRREKKPEPREDKVEAAAACEVDEQVVHKASCVCLETEVQGGESLVDEGRSLVVVGGVDEASDCL